MDPNYSWIYLIIFLAIPLSRLIPRMLAKRRREMESDPSVTIQEKQFDSNSDEPARKSSSEPTKPQSKSMLVLGELHRGSKTFENIQKNTGFEINELDLILEELERDDLIKIKQKQGLFGSKVEIRPTDKGFSKYYS